MLSKLMAITQKVLKTMYMRQTINRNATANKKITSMHLLGAAVNNEQVSISEK